MGVPLLPWQPFLNAETGALIQSFSNTNQNTAHLNWSEADTSRHTIVLGWDASLAYEVSYLTEGRAPPPSLARTRRCTVRPSRNDLLCTDVAEVAIALTGRRPLWGPSVAPLKSVWAPRRFALMLGCLIRSGGRFA